ncbi:hypothetical protein [Sulfoacidibacillus thermotolerans]|uniref:Uncharacterized protein n=1 Tax=Sulfoacidibacillus thermotolerans TaxID=1765684 RepID=A0A2U3D1M6_SULT2|nr:hypothetical protein [Sulfoacidibacillus thermotolerans]PWI55183.1 hypothetical protein BM613_13405 [Sulfoacidibacillus thermotolerans]
MVMAELVWDYIDGPFWVQVIYDPDDGYYRVYKRQGIDIGEPIFEKDEQKAVTIARKIVGKHIKQRDKR